MSALENRYRRLLRWYPRPWREQNGEMLIGTALDVAEAEGRTRPSGGEIGAMVLHGIAERATVRVALTAASLALLCAATAQLIGIVAVETVGGLGGGWIPLALGAMSGVLLTAALLAVLRHAGRTRPDRLVGMMLSASAAWAFAFLAGWSWSIAFDRAHAGVADTGFSGAFVVLLACAWALGGMTIASLVLELTRPLPPVARAAMGGFAALLCPPVLGAMTILPAGGVLASIVLVALGIRMSTARASAQTPSMVAASSTPRTAAALSRRAGLVASTCAALGTVSAAFALAGGQVVPSIDSTRAMQLGLAAGGFTGIPLLCLLGAWLAVRHPARRVPIWCAVALLIAGLAMRTADALTAAGSSGEPPWPALVPATAGVGLLVWSLARATAALRLLLAAAAAVSAVFPLWPALMAAGFLFPAVAALIAARALTRSIGARPA
ncbi:hypothetical protein AB0N64_01220 [Microbacterium sp. NPDC089318]